MKGLKQLVELRMNKFNKSLEPLRESMIEILHMNGYCGHTIEPLKDNPLTIISMNKFYGDLKPLLSKSKLKSISFDNCNGDPMYGKLISMCQNIKESMIWSKDIHKYDRENMKKIYNSCGSANWNDDGSDDDGSDYDGSDYDGSDCEYHNIDT